MKEATLSSGNNVLYILYIYVELEFVWLNFCVFMGSPTPQIYIFDQNKFWMS